MSRKSLVLSVIVTTLFTASAALAEEPRSASNQAMEKAFEQYLRRPGVMETIDAHAVSRTDKAEATIIGKLVLVDDVDFLDDGTPFRLVAIESKRPVLQDVLIFCLGSSAVNTCGRLVEGRRIQFTTDVLVVEDGESAGLALFIAKKIRT